MIELGDFIDTMMFDNNNVVKELEKQKMTPMFTEDEIAYATHPLVKLLRFIYNRSGVTKDIFIAKHRQYCLDHQVPPSAIGGKLNNHLKELKDEKITWNKFEEFLFIYFTNQLVDINISLRGADGVEKQYSLKEISDEYQKYLEEKKSQHVDD